MVTLKRLTNDKFSGIHLRALRGSEAAKCREDPLAALKTAIRRAEDEVHLYEEDNIRAPGLSPFECGAFKLEPKLELSWKKVF